MTFEEKRMNKIDLERYKSNQGKELEALIPGINNLNTVGSSPLRRGGATQILTRLQTTNKEEDLQREVLGVSQSVK